MFEFMKNVIIKFKVVTFHRINNVMLDRVTFDTQKSKKFKLRLASNDDYSSCAQQVVKNPRKEKKFDESLE